MSGEAIDFGGPPPAALEGPVPRHARRSGARTWIVRTLVVIVLLALGVAAGALVSATRDLVAYRAELDGRILPGATIAGVDVGRMTPAEATAAVTATIAPTLDRRVGLVFEGQRWHTSPRDLGATDNTEAVVAEAMAAGPPGRTLLGMAQLRWRDKEIDFTRDVAVTRPDEGARRWVESIAAAVDTAPVDARLDYSTGWVEIAAEQRGLAVDVDASTTAFLDALDVGASDVDLVVTTTEPAVTTAAFDKVLLLRQGDRKVYLYENGQITREWLVTVGTGSYPTPTGEFYVSLKRHMPTWVNPAPNGWGAGMPESIGPGPSNPLGVRALNWSTLDGGATAIRFHGTQAVNQLGRAGSHGCVRLSNAEVIELFDLVDEGTRIVSI